jgi:soluble lytic murein transglycosylase-like protein
MVAVRLVTCDPTAFGTEGRVKIAGEHTGVAQENRVKHASVANNQRIPLVVTAYDQLNAENWSAFEGSLKSLKGGDWPEPLFSLRQDLLRAALYGAAHTKQTALVQTILTNKEWGLADSDRQKGASSDWVASQKVYEQAAKKLKLYAKGFATPTQREADADPHSKAQTSAPSAASTRRRIRTEKDRISALIAAWNEGKTQEATRLAASFTWNPHRTSCQPGWIYGQYVLGRMARAAQDRKAFFRHQKRVGRELLSQKCQPRHFSMDPGAFDAFRLSELNWTARLYWENADLEEAARYAQKALADAFDRNRSGDALEALQVLYGRIAFEDQEIVQPLSEMEQWKAHAAGQAARADGAGSQWTSIVSWLEQRIALFEFQSRMYNQCAQRLATELKRRLGNLPINTWDKRRHIAQLAYWHFRCTALGTSQQIKEALSHSQALVRHFDPTGYYAMLLDQAAEIDTRSPKPQSNEEAELSEQPEFPEWPPPPLRDPRLIEKVQEFLKTVAAETSLLDLTREHPVSQYVTRWILEFTTDQEHHVFARSEKIFSALTRFLSQHKHYKDLVLSAGRLSRFVDLNDPKAAPVLEGLYPDAWHAEFQKAAELCTIDWKLLYAVARQESLFDPRAVSSAGARGVLQVMPSVWKEFFQNPAPHLSTQRLRPDDPFDPRTNIIAGACHLKESLSYYGGHLAHALAGYNAGKTAVDQWISRRPTKDMELYIEFIPYAETQEYVKRIMRTVHQLKKITFW